VLFLSRGSPSGEYFFIYDKGGECSFKGGEHSFRGSKILELQVVNPLEVKSFCFLYALISSFSVFDSKGGEVLGTKATNNISNTKCHPIQKFKILILQVVLVLQISLV
jgi:hypothetical protein